MELVVIDDLSTDEKKKLEKQEWFRQQVDFKVKVKKCKKDRWENFTGLFLMRDGWTQDNVSQHIKESFSSDQFRSYTFGLFKRYYQNTTNNINNNFKFEYQYNIKLLEDKKEEDVDDDNL